DAAIIIDDGPERLGELFEHVELLEIHGCDYCMSWRDQLPIWLVWGPRVDLNAQWMELRHLE
ncbi:hypothetical protein K8I85_04740, partial [bacterium]|nr:hypothetical protein [bacterium]